MLPRDVILEICTYLCIRDKFALLSTCKELRLLVHYLRIDTQVEYRYIVSISKKYKIFTDVKIRYDMADPTYYNSGAIRTITYIGFDRAITTPRGLIEARFSEQYNHMVTLSDTIVRVEFGAHATNWEKTGIFSREYNQYLCSREFRYSKFDHHININLPNLKYLYLGDAFNQYLILPESLVVLQLGVHYVQPLNVAHLTNLKILVIYSYRFNYPLVLPPALEILHVGDKFNQPITLPSTIREAKFGAAFDQHLFLPNGILRLSFDGPYKKRLVIPESLKYLEICHRVIAANH